MLSTSPYGWDWAAEELNNVRAQIRELQRREQDLVYCFKAMGPGVYSGPKWTVSVTEQERMLVDISSMRDKYPNEVEEFTADSKYMIVRVQNIAVQHASSGPTDS